MLTFQGKDNTCTHQENGLTEASGSNMEQTRGTHRHWAPGAPLGQIEQTGAPTGAGPPGLQAAVALAWEKPLPQEPPAGRRAEQGTKSRGESATPSRDPLLYMTLGTTAIFVPQSALTLHPG